MDDSKNIYLPREICKWSLHNLHGGFLVTAQMADRTHGDEVLRSSSIMDSLVDSFLFWLTSKEVNMHVSGCSKVR